MIEPQKSLPRSTVSDLAEARLEKARQAMKRHEIAARRKARIRRVRLLFAVGIVMLLGLLGLGALMFTW